MPYARGASNFWRSTSWGIAKIGPKGDACRNSKIALQRPFVSPLFANIVQQVALFDEEGWQMMKHEIMRMKVYLKVHVTLYYLCIISCFIKYIYMYVKMLFWYLFVCSYILIMLSIYIYLYILILYIFKFDRLIQWLYWLFCCYLSI